MAGNNEILSLSAEKLYKLACGSNRESAKEAGFYDGRFASRTQPSKKQALHLNLRRSKHNLKKEI